MPERPEAVSPSVAWLNLRQEQIRLHRAGMPSAIGTGGLLGLLMSAFLWDTVPRTHLLVWLACLALALGLRMAVSLAHARQPAPLPSTTNWLLGYRVSFAVHGLVWGLASALFLGTVDGAQTGLVTLGLTAITGGALLATAFDVAAAGLFVVPALTPLLINLLTRGSVVSSAMGLVVMLFVGSALLIALRAQRANREALDLRLQQAERAAEARHSAEQAEAARRQLADKHHLLTKLLETTQQGFWFIGPDGGSTDVNPAMCGLLGRPREAIIGRSVFDFFEGDDLALLHAQIEARRHGKTGGYEIGITRPDGSRIHCYNNATPIHDSQGRPLGSIGLWTDITDRKLAEDALRSTSEQLTRKSAQLAFTLESISQGIVAVEPDGGTSVYNRRALELLEIPEALIDGGNYDDVVRFQIQRGDLAADGGFIDAEGQRQYFKGGRKNSPDVYTRKTRAGVVLEIRTRRLPNGGLVRTFADVTRYVETQHALQASEMELRAVLDAFPGYITAIDEDHVYSYVNARFATLMARPASAIVGMSARSLLGEQRYAGLLPLIALAREGISEPVEREYPGTAERPRLTLEVIHVAGAVRPDGRQACYVFGVDISARKRAEEALVAARDEAQLANRAKSLFLSHMSHELRTPLNAILGFGQLLESDPKQPLSASHQRYVGEILHGGRHLLNLINQLLDLGSVEAGRLSLDIDPVPVADLIDECISLVRPLASAHRVSLASPRSLDRSDQVLADRLRLKQVLLNLLGNAIKYNRPEGSVSVEWHKEDGMICLAVRDTGPGLEASEQERLFQPFERLGAQQSQVEGSGIGLALSRHLVELMGGAIRLESHVGQGSTFWVQLPLGPARLLRPDPGPPEPSGISLPAGPREQRRTVLYIDDDPVNVMLMQATLARVPGVRALSATSPLTGLDLAARERPALVLVDIQMPDMDGFEVLRRLRAGDQTSRIPAIAVSASAMPGDVATGLAAGFRAYLTKPFEIDDLIEAVRQALGDDPVSSPPSGPVTQQAAGLKPVNPPPGAPSE